MSNKRGSSKEIEILRLQREVIAGKRAEAFLHLVSGRFDFVALVFFMTFVAVAVVGGSFLLFSGYPEALKILTNWWIGILVIVLAAFAVIGLVDAARRCFRGGNNG